MSLWWSARCFSRASSILEIRPTENIAWFKPELRPNACSSNLIREKVSDASSLLNSNTDDSWMTILLKSWLLIWFWFRDYSDSWFRKSLLIWLFESNGWMFDTLLFLWVSLIGSLWSGEWFRSSAPSYVSVLRLMASLLLPDAIPFMMYWFVKVFEL